MGLNSSPGFGFGGQEGKSLLNDPGHLISFQLLFILEKLESAFITNRKDSGWKQMKEKENPLSHLYKTDTPLNIIFKQLF